MKQLRPQVADRPLRMLQAFTAERRELSVNDFAAVLGLHKSTASRVAALMERLGFLERAPDGKRYLLGPEVGRLGMLAVGGRDLIGLARPVMDRLAATTGETVNLAILDDREVVNLAQSDGKFMIGGNWTGRRTLPHCVANGKVLLAFGGGPLPRTLPAYTPTTITSQKALRDELEIVVRRGWATNVGEVEAGLHGIAAPVFDQVGRCIAAVSLFGPQYRLPAERLPDYAGLVVAAGREISDAVAGSGVMGGPGRRRGG